MWNSQLKTTMMVWKMKLHRAYTLLSLLSELKLVLLHHSGLCCPVWWNILVVCLLEWELWCFNELKGLLILNLITLFRPSRLPAFTLIVIYGSSTLCFLIKHLHINVIMLSLHSSLSLIIQLGIGVVFILQYLSHSSLWLRKRNSPTISPVCGTLICMILSQPVLFYIFYPMPKAV